MSESAHQTPSMSPGPHLSSAGALPVLQSDFYSAFVVIDILSDLFSFYSLLQRH